MRGKEIEEEKGTERRSSEVEAKTDIAMTSSVAKETNTFSAGNNRACSYGRSRKNECGNGEGIGIGGRSGPQKRLLCYGDR